MKATNTITALALIFGLIIADGICRADVMPPELTPASGNWSFVGVPGGIPNRVVGANPSCSTLNPGVTIDQINTAITSCGNSGGGVVYLSAGSYNLSAGSYKYHSVGIALDVSNVTLRGAGANQTKLSFNNINGSDMITIGRAGDPGGAAAPGGYSTYIDPNVIYSFPYVDWDAGIYPKGTTQITLARALTSAEQNQINGAPACFDELGDNVNVFTKGKSGRADSGSTRDSPTSNRSLQECVLITGISPDGKTVTFTPGLMSSNWKKSQTPQMFWWSKSNTVFNSGVEDLSIVEVNSSGIGVQFNGTYGSWLKGVRIANHGGNVTDTYTVVLRFSANAEIRDSFMHDNVYVNIVNGKWAVSNILIENNIFKPIGEASSANSGVVYAYNYIYGTVLLYNSPDRPSWQNETILAHGNQPHMNLFEGNETYDICFDDTFGGSDHSMIFRNRLTAWDGSAGHTGNTVPFYIADYHSYIDIIGNLLGHPSISASYIGLLGLQSIPVPTTMVRWQNYDVYANQMHMTTSELGTTGGPLAGVTQFPASLYYGYGSFPAKPQWWNAATWTTNLPWPAIHTDSATAGRTGVAQYVEDIPAKQCAAHLNLAINPAAFNARACYGADFGRTSGPILIAPKNFRKI